MDVDATRRATAYSLRNTAQNGSDFKGWATAVIAQRIELCGTEQAVPQKEVHEVLFRQCDLDLHLFLSSKPAFHLSDFVDTFELVITMAEAWEKVKNGVAMQAGAGSVTEQHRFFNAAQGDQDPSAFFVALTVARLTSRVAMSDREFSLHLFRRCDEKLHLALLADPDFDAATMSPHELAVKMADVWAKLGPRRAASPPRNLPAPLIAGPAQAAEPDEQIAPQLPQGAQEATPPFSPAASPARGLLQSESPRSPSPEASTSSSTPPRASHRKIRPPRRYSDDDTEQPQSKRARAKSSRDSRAPSPSPPPSCRLKVESPSRKPAFNGSAPFDPNVGQAVLADCGQYLYWPAAIIDPKGVETKWFFDKVKGKRTSTSFLTKTLPIGSDWTWREIKELKPLDSLTPTSPIMNWGSRLQWAGNNKSLWLKGKSIAQDPSKLAQWLSKPTAAEMEDFAEWVKSEQIRNKPKARKK